MKYGRLDKLIIKAFSPYIKMSKKQGKASKYDRKWCENLSEDQKQSLEYRKKYEKWKNRTDSQIYTDWCC